MNCLVTVQNVEVAYKIWVADIAALKGKTMRQTPSSVMLDIVWTPKEIRELHHNVTLSVDIFFVNNIPFLLTLSRKIQFTTVTHLTDH